jgi:DNA topoisomerase-1
VVIPGKEKVLAKLKKLALSADHIYLAPDPDREGEAIAAHLADELGEDSSKKKKGKKKAKTDDVGDGARIRRVTFNEITQRAVKAAFEHPRDIDRNLVDAQQTRRVLDRLVGYQVSPLLWDKVRRGLSAGRVQTVALRLIVDREREIKAFEKKEYWTIDANLAANKPPAFDARFLGKGEEKIEVTNGEQAEQIRVALEKADWVVRSAEKKERRRNATPPFTTSKLQQDSSRKLRFSVKRTMMIAQRLYEGVELGDEGQVGLILLGWRPRRSLRSASMSSASMAPTIFPSLPMHIRIRRMRKGPTKPFVRPLRCAIPTRSNNICRRTNSRFTN